MLSPNLKFNVRLGMPGFRDPGWGAPESAWGREGSNEEQGFEGVGIRVRIELAQKPYVRGSFGPKASGNCAQKPQTV